MVKIKKAGIIAGAVVGGVIGGAMSVVGKVAGKSFIDELGESIVDSAIYSGEIAGNLASGAANTLIGKARRDSERAREGLFDLKTGGGQIVGNFVSNVKTVVENSGDMVEGVRQKDRKRIVRGAKTLAKVITVGAITVGAIKIKKSDADSAPQQNASDTAKTDPRSRDSAQRGETTESG